MGDHDDAKKLHWASWEKLTTPKEVGGLAFKSLDFMNEALLAKQLWRLITEPHLLMSRVLKGKYFPHQDLLDARVRGSDSWLWKSWLAAKASLQSGLRWRVIDGRSIRIWEDKWLPDSISSKVLSRQPESSTIMFVRELIEEQGGNWNQALIEQLFLPQEARQILSIPLSQFGYRDQLLWTLEKHGQFTVRSAYEHVQQAKASRTVMVETSHAREQTSRMWQKTWKMHVKPKLKHFM